MIVVVVLLQLTVWQLSVVIMWWKLVLLTIYLAVLFVLSRILEVVTHYQGGYLPSRLLDPVSLSVQRLKALLDQRGVSYTGIVERHELTELVQQSGVYSAWFHLVQSQVTLSLV